MRGPAHDRQEPRESGLSVQTRQKLLDLLPGLLTELEQQIRQDVDTPFTEPLIVVPGPAVREWLEHAIADRQGIAASLDLPTLPELVARLADAVHGPLPASIRFASSPGLMPLRILAILERIAVEAPPQARPLARFLEQSASIPERRYGLARALADRFQAYLTARHDVLAGWERDPSSDFQGYVWQELVRADRSSAEEADEVTTEVFGATRLLGLDDAIREGRADAALPRRLQLFGFSTLQPLHADLLAAASTRAHISLHLSAPSVAFHEYSESGATLELLHRLARPADDLVRIAEERLGLDHEDLVGDHAALTELPGSSDGDPLLATLQTHVWERRSRDDDPLPSFDPTEDPSLQIVRCASPRREVEVCRETVWKAFDELEDLRPDEIAILVPDVTRYASLVRSVFEVSGTDETKALPIHIADRRARERVPTGAAFLALLEFAEGPFDRASFLDLLRREPMRESAGRTADEIEAFGDRLEDAGVSWGFDQADRSRLDAPDAFAEGTFRNGLERLALGHATGPLGEVSRRSSSGIDQRRPVPLALAPHTLVPTDHGSAARAEQIDQLADLSTGLAKTCATLRVNRPLGEWPRILLEALETHLGQSRRARELSAVREAIGMLSRAADALDEAGEEIELPLGTIRTALEDLLDEVARPPFVTGSITLSALRPLRHLPFRVVCVLGLVDGEFPRESEELPFDLVARKPRPGDRNARDDDRMAFLEALLAAGERALLTYPGRSAVTGTERAPSTCLAALFDWCHKSYASDDLRDRLVVDAPIRADDPEAFHPEADPRVLVTDPQAFATATRRREAPDPFELVANHLDAPAQPDRLELTLSDLRRFWRDPSQWFLSQVLDLRLERDTEVPVERERQTATSLEDWSLRDALASVRAEGSAEDWRASGITLQSPLAAAHVRKTWREAEDLLHRLGDHTFLPPLPIDVELEHEGRQLRLLGEIDGRASSRLIHWRAGKLKWQHLMPLAVDHALASVLTSEEERADSQNPFAGFTGSSSHFRDRSMHFRRMSSEAAHELLFAMARGFWIGQHLPLPFDANTLGELTDKALKSESLIEDLEGGSLESKWNGIREMSPALQLVYRHSRPWQQPGFGTWVEQTFLAFRACEGGPE